jgi:pilus assembly protein CpaC
MAAFVLVAAVALAAGGLTTAPGAAEAAARVIKLSDANRVAKLQVTIGQSESLRISLPFSDIVVGDPETADVSPLTNKTLYVLGRKLGITNVTLFDANKQVLAVIDIEVTQNLTDLRQVLNENIPGARIRVRSINGRVLLDGMVPSAPAAEKAMRLARAFAGEDVTNSLTIAANQQVNLEVRFLEVNRLAGKDLGINWNLTKNNEGLLTGTGVQDNGTNLAPAVITGALSGAFPFGTILANVLGNGVSPDLVISALEQRKLARRLAEPNLTAVSGESANFLAGGEFPFRNCTGAGVDRDCSIEFKPFGVRLAFTPVVLDDGLINLKIEPSVSELNFSINIDGVPGLNTRQARTSVELRDGQSFAIAGLLQTVNERQADQVPWIGDVPVLGTLFRSSSFQKRESDLVIIVTPRLVRPVGTREQLASPLDDTLSSNEPELFLFGKLEVSRQELDKKFNGQYGHILDLPKGTNGAVYKQ